MDQHINRESMYNISNLAYSIRGMDDGNLNSSDAEDEMPPHSNTLKRLEADLSNELKSPDGTKVDLFSEIHLNELKRLEKQLESIEGEKTSLTTNLRDAQQNLDKSQNDLQNFMAKVTLLAAHVDSLHNLKKQIETDDKMKGEFNQSLAFKYKFFKFPYQQLTVRRKRQSTRNSMRSYINIRPGSH